MSSPSFADGGAIPPRFTADGDKRFPGVAWEGLPAQTQSVVLLVEDADIPFARPVTHLIVHSIPPGLGKLGEGEVPLRLQGVAFIHRLGGLGEGEVPLRLQAGAGGWACGRNFLGRPGWTPPAPPPGHGRASLCVPGVRAG